VLEFGGFHGVGTGRYPLPWSVLKYDTSLDGYVVPIDKRRLEEAPRYPESDVPDYERLRQGQDSHWAGVRGPGNK